MLLVTSTQPPPQQSDPLAHGSVALHPIAHIRPVHTIPAGQSPAPRHSTQLCVLVSQRPIANTPPSGSAPPSRNMQPRSERHPDTH